MKGIARTQKEVEFHDRVAQLGCISCRQEGNYNPWVSIHHAHGRTKPGCHMWVLPLCEPHHQDNGTAIARHPYKRRWEAKYGNEDDLIREMWTELGVEFTEPVREAKPVDRDRPKRATSEAAEIGVVKLREIKPKVEKPARPKIQPSKPTAVSTSLKAKENSPVKPKAKIRSGGFPKAAKPTNNLRSKFHKAPKPVITEKQVTYLAESKAARKKNKVIQSEEYKTKTKEAAKARRAEYMEKNKSFLDERKEIQKEHRKKQIAELKASRR